MADERTKFIVECDTTGAVKSIRELTKAEDELKKSSKDAGKSVEDLGKGIVVANQAAELLGKAFGGAVNSIKAVFQGLREVQQVEGVARAFQDLQRSIGLVADESLAKLRTATQGVVNDFELMKATNLAQLMGVNVQAFDQLSAAAQKLGQATGRTATEALNDLVVGVGRGSKLILDNLGIIVDTEKAYRDYARALGVTVDALDDVQKKEAFQKAALDAIAQKSKELGPIQQTAALAANQLATAFENQKNAAFLALSENKDLADALARLAVTISSINIKPLIDGLAEVAAVMTSTASAAIALANEIINLFNIAKAQQSSAMKEGVKTIETMESLTKKLEGFQTASKKLTSPEEIAAFRKEFEAFGEQFATLPNKAIQKALSDLALETTKVVNENIATVEGALKKIDSIAPKIKIDLPADKIKEFASNLNELIRLEKTGTLTDAEYTKAKEKLKKEFVAAGGSVERFEKLMKSLNDQAMKPAAERAKKLAEQQEKLRRQMQSLNALIDFRNRIERIIKAKDELGVSSKRVNDALNEEAKAWERLGGSAEEARRQIELAKNANIAETLQRNRKNSQTISGNDSGSSDPFAKMLAGATGLPEQGKSGEFGYNAEAMSGLLQDSLMKAVRMAINGTKEQVDREVYGEMIGEVTGALIGSYFGPLGAQIGAELGSAIGIAIAKLGGDSKGTKAKKALDKYFADLFDPNRLTVIINGQIQQIKDLEFSGNQEGGGLFASLSEDAKTAFEAIGTAFEGLQGIEADLAVNLGNVLANNLGGDLNNLQLLVQATGESFEDLSEVIINTFLIGNISILEAATSLQKLNDIMAKGIPGAVGAVGTAFDNIAKAGDKGGRALIDAIQDVAAEAKELGINDLPALHNALINTFGKGAKEVEQFFQAMAASGIHSLEQLLNASQTALISIAGNLAQIQANQTPTFTPASLGDKPETSSGSGRGVSGFSGGRSSKPSTKDFTLTVIPELARVAVRGIDDAIKELVKLDQSAKGVFNKKFFNDFRLGMNEMQVAAGALGISFQDLETQAIASFKAGKTTASEAAKAIADAGQGIPGIVGAVGDAVRNLKQFGTQGGLFSLDALRDIGAEGVEAGIKALDKEQRDALIEARARAKLAGRDITKDLLDAAKKVAATEVDKENDPFTLLRNRLLGQGIDGASIDQLFAQLDKAGIDSLDKLKNVSDEIGIQILGGLEKSGFAFGQTEDKITKLLDRLDKLERARDVTVTMNVKSGKITLDAPTKNLLKLLGIDLKDLVATKGKKGVEQKSERAPGRQGNERNAGR